MRESLQFIIFIVINAATYNYHKLQDYVVKRSLEKGKPVQKNKADTINTLNLDKTFHHT